MSNQLWEQNGQRSLQSQQKNAQVKMTAMCKKISRASILRHLWHTHTQGIVMAQNWEFEKEFPDTMCVK